MVKTLPTRPQISRNMLAQVFPDPRMVLAFERVLDALSPAGSVFSTGDLKPFAGGTAPDGWLVCDGSEVSRVGFPNLFSVISTTWGAGDGTNTFNLPDLRDRTLVGASATKPLGATGGAESTVLTIAQLPAHNHDVHDPGHLHDVTDPEHAHGITDPEHAHTAEVSGTANLGLDSGISGTTAVPGSTGSSPTGISVNSGPTGVTVNAAETGVTTLDAGGGEPVSILPPYAAVTYLIKT